MPRLVETLFGFVRGQKAHGGYALFASATTNALDIESERHRVYCRRCSRNVSDNLRVPRRVLSCSIEDTGTM